MASSLEVNKVLAAILTAGILASGSGVISRMIYHTETPQQPAYKIPITETTGGAQEAAKEPEQPIAVLLASASAEKGQTVAKKCERCHNFEEGAGKKVGPDLHGVLGRQIASVSGFDYSDALKEKEGAWDYEKLNEWLTDPRQWAPGTKMNFVGLS
ncbi:MAG: c-type cytochrome, partial [Geminicoccaceae bacterium]